MKTGFRSWISLRSHVSIENSWKGAVSLSKVRPDDVPISPGLIELKEEKRYLYISHNKNIQSAIRQLGTGDAFRLMANNFWKPRLEAITRFLRM